MKKSLSSLCAILCASLVVAAGPATATEQLPPSINPHLNSKYLLQYRGLLVELKHHVDAEQLDIKNGTPLREAPTALAGADGYTIIAQQALDTTDGVPAMYQDMDTNVRTVPEQIPGGLRGRQQAETTGQLLRLTPELKASNTGDRFATSVLFLHNLKTAAGKVGTVQVSSSKELAAGDYTVRAWEHEGQQFALILQLSAVERIKHD
ncbi:hypothetical protein IB232_21520 [Pseudomonas sp. PDM15]|uniref:hypothetical protein n=1 Tax=Pseudomonas sp. PDM15 TaxID=2769303 RepID=UPI001782F5A5|nr:hypothetical protein [Pseudomonas sp. PDM15]MBD9427920.1 hypothetical protein [Pseudomonas sp. PDM15]